MIVSKTRNAPGWATKADNLIPNGVKCNENVIWVSVLRLQLQLQLYTAKSQYWLHETTPTVPAFASGLNKFYAFNWYFSLVILCFH